jgi:hypothetical protein
MFFDHNKLLFPLSLFFNVNTDLFFTSLNGIVREKKIIGMKNLVSVLLTAGSPALAAYCLFLTVYERLTLGY